MPDPYIKAMKNLNLAPNQCIVVEDSIQGIYKAISDCAMISKWAGGIGLWIHNIRGKNSLIRGTNGKTSGIVPMLKVFNDTKAVGYSTNYVETVYYPNYDVGYINLNILLIIIASFAFVSLNLTLFLRLKKYSNNKKIISFISKFRNFSAYMMIIILSYVFIDMVVLRLLGHGYPSDHEQEYIQRIPSPYDMFSGKPNVRDHNSDGFRGNDFVNAAEKQLSIAFFGGSTGYEGNPPIVDLVNQKLNSDNIKTIVYNFSSVSSNHNQHLHRLLKFSKYNFDIVIFYGGFNETFQTLYADPRPGYPFNFWTVGELHPLKFTLLKYSPFFSEIDKS